MIIKVIDKESGALWVGHSSMSKDSKRPITMVNFNGISFNDPTIAAATMKAKCGWNMKLTVE